MLLFYQIFLGWIMLNLLLKHTLWFACELLLFLLMDSIIILYFCVCMCVCKCVCSAAGYSQLIKLPHCLSGIRRLHWQLIWSEDLLSCCHATHGWCWVSMGWGRSVSGVGAWVGVLVGVGKRKSGWSNLSWATWLDHVSFCLYTHWNPIQKIWIIHTQEHV